MIFDIIHIAIYCIVVGSASIPLSFHVNSNPIIVWIGNSLGSLLSAMVVIYIGNRITSDNFKQKVRKYRVGNKIIMVFEQDRKSPKMQKTTSFINRHGLRLFSLLCPVFPGVTLSTAAVYLLGFDRKLYVKWMLIGVVFVSGAYCFGYWWLAIR